MNSFGAFVQNILFNRNRYRTHQDAIVISCFYNPQGNPYRLMAFQKWYRSIKHLNHRIIECLIGPDAKPQLPDSQHITRIRTDSLLWHKETLLNKIVSELPREFKYVFWVDADVLFTNKNWLVDGVRKLQKDAVILQPFEYCVHLDKGQLRPGFDLDGVRGATSIPAIRHPMVWKSFASNHANRMGGIDVSANHNYDRHGHVGFAWGARRYVLESCPLYDKALVGGADHIIAHAAAGHVPHPCITKAFADNLDEVMAWSRRFYDAVGGRIGYVPGDLYHIWHGDLGARDYLKRVKEFTSTAAKITTRDANGLLVGNKEQTAYVRNYFKTREAGFDGDGILSDPEFIEDMGYVLADLVLSMGQPTYSDPAPVDVDDARRVVMDDLTQAGFDDRPGESVEAEPPQYDSGSGVEVAPMPREVSSENFS